MLPNDEILINQTITCLNLYNHDSFGKLRHYLCKEMFMKVILEKKNHYKTILIDWVLFQAPFVFTELCK